ncbi:UNVERIFIED_CONTAM: hypothetical protein HDU68_006415 [Siphonaria sp. JEL0065]|nr:hypothetical protein HDU68_006415 [Siphonaria sp. JEL0065]
MATGRLAVGSLISTVAEALPEADEGGDGDKNYSAGEVEPSNALQSNTPSTVLAPSSTPLAPSTKTNLAAVPSVNSTLSLPPPLDKGKKRLSATNGERAKRTHTAGSSSKDQLAELSRNVSQAVSNLSHLVPDPVQLPNSTTDPFACLPESMQMMTRASRRLGP